MPNGSRVLPAAVDPAAEVYDSGMDNAHRRPVGRILLIVILVVAVAAVLAVIGLSRGSGSPVGEQGTPTVATPVASGATATASPSATSAPTTATSGEALTAAPAGVTWELYQGVALPKSAADGPNRVDGYVHGGFSHTPAGALIAAAQIGTRSLVTPDLTGLRTIAQEQLVDGPGKTAWLHLIAGLTENDPPAGGYAQYVGFRYITYTPDVAVLSLAAQGSSGVIQVGTDTMRWVDGDWKLQKPSDGLQHPQTVTSLVGYVLWSGVR